MSLATAPTQTAQTRVPRYIVRRGCALAESRLRYLAELFESGRWRRYHSEIEFLANIQEAKEAVERWRAMLADEAVGAPLMPWQTNAAAEPAPAYQGTVLYEAPHRARSAVPQPVEELVQPPKPATAPTSFDWQRALDQETIAERYPILRAAM